MPTRQSKTHQIRNLLFKIGWNLLRPVFLFFLRPEILYDQSIKYKGPYIIAANHISFLDPPTLGCLLPLKWQIYPLRFMARDRMMNIPLWGNFLKILGAFPVKRGTDLNTVLKEPLKVLKRGQSLLVFPQGHRQKKFDIQQGRKGTAAIALASQAPILPIAIFGIYKTGFFSFLFRRKKLIIVVGRPFVLKRDKKKKLEQDAREKIKDVMINIQKLYNYAQEVSKKS